MVTPHLPWKFHANRSSRFLVMLLTKKQRNKERNRPKTIPRPSTGGGGNEWMMLYVGLGAPQNSSAVGRWTCRVARQRRPRASPAADHLDAGTEQVVDSENQRHEIPRWHRRAPAERRLPAVSWERRSSTSTGRVADQQRQQTLPARRRPAFL